MLNRPLRAALVGAAAMLFLVAPRIAAEQTSPKEIWPQATAATDSGDYKGGDKKLGELLEAGKTLGIRRFPLFAESAIALARQASAQGNHEVEQWARGAAQKLDPYSPNVAFSTADFDRQRSDWGSSLSNVFRGFSRSMSDTTARTLAQSDMLVSLSLALLSAIAVCAIVLFLRYSRSAAHDFREVIGQRVTPGMATVLAYAALIFPLFLWLGPMWLLLFWLAFFFGYATHQERAVIVVLLLIAAALPIGVSWAAYRAAGVDSPVVRAAIASDERSYDPETVRRLRDLVEIIPDEPKLQLLLGNLLVQEGDEQQASTHYRRAIELNDRSAGAHVNLGNLHFVDNDFVAASTEYQKAEAIDPGMAIAYYNESVAAGELYKYAEQGQKLAEAKKFDHVLVDRLVANPPAQKIVRYNVPVDDAWLLANRIAQRRGAREIFGNFARFDLLDAALNTLTIGSILALLAGIVLTFIRRKTGFADACIKCGRTFCDRCKSSRDSAIYCTQCIHIYLKRDGVSLDTKRAKLEEVHRYQTGSVKIRKLLSTFFPGSGFLHEGKPVAGIAVVALFMLLVSTAFLVGRLAPIAYPAETMRLVIRVVASILAAVVWLVFTLPVYRQRGNV